MQRKLNHPATLIFWLIASVYLTACNSGGGAGETGSSFLGELKDFFVAPVQDSIIAAKDSASVASSSLTTLSAVSPQSISHDDTMSDSSDDTSFRFDLTRLNLESCAAYNKIKNEPQFEHIRDGDIFALGNAFAWSSDNSIDLYLPGEFSYLSTFMQSCWANTTMEARGIKKPSIDELKRDGGKRYEPFQDQTFDVNVQTEVTLAVKVDALTDLTLDSTDNPVVTQRDIDELKLRRFMLPSLKPGSPMSIYSRNEGAYVPADSVWFFRVYQAVSTDDKDSFSVFHHITFSTTVNQSDDSIDTLEQLEENNRLLLKQKFTLVVNDQSNNRQFVGFVSTYPYNKNCAPLYDEKADKYQYDAYDFVYDDPTNDLIDGELRDTTQSVLIPDNANKKCKPDGATTTAPYFKDLSTDIMVHYVIIEKGVGSFSHRTICQDVGKRGFTTQDSLKQCVQDADSSAEYKPDNLYSDKFYNTAGEEAVDQVDMSDELAAWGDTLYNQIESYVDTGQLATSRSEVAGLMGEELGDNTDFSLPMYPAVYISAQYGDDPSEGGGGH